MGVRTVEHVGTGTSIAIRTNGKILWILSDIVFSVDLSCSMNDDAAALGDEFDTFINELSNYSNDWQIGQQTIMMDVIADILKPTTPNYTSLFSNYVQGCNNPIPLGPNPCENENTERLLTVAANK